MRSYTPGDHHKKTNGHANSKARSNPLQLLQDGNVSNPLAQLSVQPKLSDPSVTQLSIVPIPEKEEIIQKKNAIGQVVQRVWTKLEGLEAGGLENYYKNDDYDISDGIIWYYNGDSNTMSFELVESPHEHALSEYQDQSKTYDEWMDIWRENRWLNEDSSDDERGDSSDDERDDDSKDGKEQVAYGAGSVSYTQSKKGEVRMNTYLAVNDGTTLWTTGLVGCISICIIGAGGRRYLGHFGSSIAASGDYGQKARDAFEHEREQIRTIAEGATLIVVTGLNDFADDADRRESLTDFEKDLKLTGVVYREVGTSVALTTTEVIPLRTPPDWARAGIVQ